MHGLQPLLALFGLLLEDLSHGHPACAEEASQQKRGEVFTELLVVYSLLKSKILRKNGPDEKSVSGMITNGDLLRSYNIWPIRTPLGAHTPPLPVLRPSLKAEGNFGMNMVTIYT